MGERDTKDGHARWEARIAAFAENAPLEECGLDGGGEVLQLDQLALLQFRVDLDDRRADSREVITDEEAPQYLGYLAAFAGFDNPTSNDKTREVLGWESTHPGWVQDVETGHYFG